MTSLFFCAPKSQTAPSLIINDPRIEKRDSDLSHASVRVHLARLRQINQTMLLMRCGVSPLGASA